MITCAKCGNRVGVTGPCRKCARSARLERALAKANDEAENQRQAAIMNAEQRDKANADKAVLVEALTHTLDRFDCVLMGKSVRDADETILLARAALSQVQA